MQVLGKKLKSSYDDALLKLSAHPNLDVDIEISKECTNLVLLLCALYALKVVHSVIICDLMQLFVNSFTAIDVELLLVLLQTCGVRLRLEDADSLKAILAKVANKAAILTSQASRYYVTNYTILSPFIDLLAQIQHHPVFSRVKFMMEAIADLKNNRRKLIIDTSADYETLIKVVRNLCDKRSQMFADALRIPWQDLLAADERGYAYLLI